MNCPIVKQNDIIAKQKFYYTNWRFKVSSLILMECRNNHPVSWAKVERVTSWWSPFVKMSFEACGENRLVSMCLKLPVTTSVWECWGHVVDRQSAGWCDGLLVRPVHAMTCNIMRSSDEMMDTREMMSSYRLTWCQYDLGFFYSDSCTKV